MEERQASEGYGQNKLPLIPMEGKVQINSYSHFNAFMLMRAPGERDGLTGGSGLKLTAAPEKMSFSTGKYGRTGRLRLTEHTHSRLQFAFLSVSSRTRPDWSGTITVYVKYLHPSHIEWWEYWCEIAQIHFIEHLADAVGACPPATFPAKEEVGIENG